MKNEIPATSRTDRSNKLLTTNRDRQTEYEYYDEEEDENEGRNVYDFRDFMDDKLLPLPGGNGVPEHTASEINNTTDINAVSEISTHRM